MKFKVDLAASTKALRRSRNIAIRQQLARLAGRRDTLLRQMSFNDHRPPSGRHSKGRQGMWHGTHRVLDPGARRRASQRAYRTEMLRQRVEHVKRSA